MGAGSTQKEGGTTEGFRGAIGSGLTVTETEFHSSGETSEANVKYYVSSTGEGEFRSGVEGIYMESEKEMGLAGIAVMEGMCEGVEGRGGEPDV